MTSIGKLIPRHILYTFVCIQLLPLAASQLHGGTVTHAGIYYTCVAKESQGGRRQADQSTVTVKSSRGKVERGDRLDNQINTTTLSMII